MSDLKLLKARNPIAEVIQETGFPLVFNSDKNLWIGRNNPELQVEPSKSHYRMGLEKGDVLDWLCKRFAWTFGQAVSYLENRANLPESARANLLPILEEQQENKRPDGAHEWLEGLPSGDRKSIKDWRVREALRLAWDYPGGGIERFIGVQNYITVFREIEWLPTQFVTTMGLLADLSCSLCDCDLSGWQRPGQAFQALESQGDELIMIPEAYCSKCLDKIKRWRQAFELLASWIAEQGRKEGKA